MISARGVCRTFSDGEQTLKVLDRVDLEVREGEMVAIMGRSGSGKSTLLHVLGGLDASYQGEVTVAGTRLDGLSDKKLARFRNSQVAFVFQSFHLMPGLSVADNVCLPAFFSAEPPDRAWALSLLGRVGLKEKAHRTSAQLSGGERQRVALARALYPRPKLLLCDEPTGNLDASTGEQIIALFSQLNREGLTVLTVTHEERVSAQASRVLRLNEGKLS